MSLVTFLIPSLGRPYLRTTVKSLQQQTDPDWEAIILFDGIYINRDTYNPEFDGRIHEIHYKKIGFPGKMRNLMFPFVDSKWIGFVDDDNHLENTYVERLRQYETDNVDLVHFSMLYTWSSEHIPNKHVNELTYGQFGMSFSVKRDFVNQHNIRFSENSGNEDYDFLVKCKDAGVNINITHDAQYVVPKISAWNF